MDLEGHSLHWEFTLWESTVSGYRFGIWGPFDLGVYSLGLYRLGVYLGVYTPRSLGTPITDLGTHSLRSLLSGILLTGSLQSGSLQSRATDFGFGEANACP